MQMQVLFAEGIGSDLPSSFFYLSLSNTVGGAIFHDGNLLPGDAFRCGEAGHMTLIPDGKPCYCGKTGCVDAYCSARLLSDLSGGRLEDFFLGLQQNNPDYRSVWDTYLKHLAVVINNLHMILDYDIVLGGYVGSFLCPLARYDPPAGCRTQYLRRRWKFRKTMYLSDRSGGLWGGDGCDGRDFLRTV